MVANEEEPEGILGCASLFFFFFGLSGASPPSDSSSDEKDFDQSSSLPLSPYPRPLSSTMKPTPNPTLDTIKRRNLGTPYRS
jgi:hypothetical protein